MELRSEKRRIWKIDGNWNHAHQSISMCECVSMDSHRCTRCTDTFTSYLEYLTHTCKPKVLYECCVCRHLYVNCDEFQSHECQSCETSLESTNDNRHLAESTCVRGNPKQELDVAGVTQEHVDIEHKDNRSNQETSHSCQKTGLSAEAMKHTNTKGTMLVSTQSSGGVVQKTVEEEVDTDADSSHNVDSDDEMEENTSNTSINDSMPGLSVDNESILQASGSGSESATDSQEQVHQEASGSEVVSDSQEQVKQETRSLQGKNELGQKSSSATGGKKSIGTKVRKRRDPRTVKKEMARAAWSKVILNQIARVEGKEKMTRDSLVNKVVESELQRIVSTTAQPKRNSKWRSDGETTQVPQRGDPKSGSEGEKVNSVSNSERDTWMSSDSISKISSGEVPDTQSGPHPVKSEVPQTESNEEESCKNEGEIHSLKKSNRNPAENGHLEEVPKLVLKKLEGASSLPTSDKEFRVYKLVTLDPCKDVKNNSSLIQQLKLSKPAKSTPPKGVKDNRSLIKLLSSPPSDSVNQHSLQTSLLPPDNVFSPAANSNIQNSSQLEHNPDPVARNLTSATAADAGEIYPVSISQKGDNSNSQFRGEDPNITIVKTEPMDDSDFSAYHSEYVFDVPHVQDREMDPNITTCKSEPVDDSSDILSTQDTEEDENIASFKSEPVDNISNFSVCHSENPHDFRYSQVAEKVYETSVTSKSEPSEDSSELRAYYSENQIDIQHTQAIEGGQNLAIVKSEPEDSNMTPDLSYIENYMKFVSSSVTTPEPSVENEAYVNEKSRFWLYNCKTCGKKFKHAGTLMVHERAHNLEKKEHQCFICGRICTAASYLKVHLRTHKEEPEDMGKRKLACFKCDERFVHEENFQTHMRMHFQKGLSYCIKCGKGFYRKAQLDRHMETHAEKVFPCKYCDREFSTLAGRTIHQKMHTKEKRTINFKCPVCGRLFKKNKSLYEDHLKEHGQGTLFICPVCGHGFSMEGELTLHQKKHFEIEKASSHVLSAVRGLVSQRQ